MASIYTYPAPVYIEGPNASLVGLDALARAGTQFMAGQQAAKGDAFKQQSAMADMMAKQAQAAKYAAETQLLNRQYDEGNRLGETLGGLSRMNQGQSPFPTPAETGEMFRRTPQQQEGFGGEVLARFLRSYEMKNPEQAAGALGQFQNMRLQNEGAGLARQAGLPDLGLAAFMAQTAAGKPSDPYQSDSFGQITSPFMPQVMQTPASRAKVADIGDNRTALERQAAAIGLAPGTQPYADFIRENAGGVKISMGPQETEYDKAVGKQFAEQYIGIQKAAEAAHGQSGQLDLLQKALQQARYTGMGAESLLDIRRALRMTGIEVGDVSNEELIQAMGNRMALDMRNPAGGAGMPGAMSDKDREFLAASVPGLTKTPEGNLRLIDMMRKLNQRKIEVANLANDYVQRNGRMDANFQRELARWSENNRLFTDEQTEVYEVGPNGALKRVQ